MANSISVTAGISDTIRRGGAAWLAVARKTTATAGSATRRASIVVIEKPW
jgi:hypothetical protein